MDKNIDIELLDKKMQEKGWKFFGPILHYKKAWKNQAAIYEKKGKYIVSGINTTGKADQHNGADILRHLDGGKCDTSGRSFKDVKYPFVKYKADNNADAYSNDTAGETPAQFMKMTEYSELWFAITHFAADASSGLVGGSS